MGTGSGFDSRCSFRGSASVTELHVAAVSDPPLHAVPAPGRAGPPSPKRFVRLEATESYTVREGSGWIEWMVCWRMRPVEGEKV